MTQLALTDRDLGRLAELGVATVYEGAGQEGLLDVPLIQLVSGSRVAGPARTVLCGQDDNLAVHAAIEQICPGEVVVLTMPEPRPVALIGDLLAIQIKVHGAAAILVDAGVRDVEELVRLGVPVWTRFIRARAATKRKVGEINGMVTVGGTQIAVGDVIVLDADGAVSVRHERIARVIKASEERCEKENRLREQLLAGQTTYDLLGLRGKS